MKFKVRKWLDNEPELGKEIAFLPHLCFFWSEGTYCLAFGWIVWSIEIWWGKTEDLI